jgi:hypothetical protein
VSIGLSVTNKVFGDGGLSGAKLAGNSIPAGKLAANSVDSGNYIDGSIDGIALSQDGKEASLLIKRKAKLNKFTNFLASNATFDDITTEVLNIAINKRLDGSPNQEGVDVTTSIKCQIREMIDGKPIVIEATNGQDVYGVLEEDGSIYSGTLISNYTNGSPLISGANDYNSNISVGDYVTSPTYSSGKLYKVAAVTSSLITLEENFQGPTHQVGGVYKAKININYKYDDGSEQDFTMPAGKTLQVLYPESYNLKDEPYTADLNAIGYSDALPESHQHQATDITYNNATSGLTATDVQAAIDEVAANAGGAITQESPSVTTQNQIVISNNAVQASVQVIFGGIEKLVYGTHYTVGGTGNKTITILPGGLGYNVDIGDPVEVIYQLA